MKYIQNLTKTNLVVGRLEIAPGKSGEITDSEVESDGVMYAVRSNWARVSDLKQKDLDMDLPEVEFARPAIMGYATPPVDKQEPEPLPEEPVAEAAAEAVEEAPVKKPRGKAKAEE